MNIYLTNGQEIEIHEDGFEGLFDIIVLANETVLPRKNSTPQTWRRYREFCLIQLAYVAGQLREAGSTIGYQLLLDGFRTHWDEERRKIQVLAEDLGVAPEEEPENNPPFHDIFTDLPPTNEPTDWL